ncbi:MAG TPA: hypothetical protein DCG75_16460 [Bacteroidales bacterium]|nr:hypothetical protein [Bacteroidales bacterium]
MTTRNCIYISFVGVLFLAFSSCSIFKTKQIANNELVIFPSPPDTARVQFLTSISTSKDIEKKQSSFSAFVLGENEAKTIYKPYGIDVHGGKIYICDSPIKGLEIIDLEKETFEYFIPKGKGELALPVNCSVDENGYIYIADVQRRQIVVFDHEGIFIESYGEKENFKPTDVFVTKDKIWVVNSENHRVSVYNKDNYNLLYYFPKSETGDDGFLYSPTNISISDEKVYVSDFGDFKIKVYTHDGNFINSIGSYGKRPGQFVRPKGVAVDKNSNLYVVDAGFENTQIFNKDGNLLMFFGGSYTGSGYMWLPAKVLIDYDHLRYFEKYVDKSYHLKYLIFVTNQYGPDKINIYGSVEPK